MKRWKNGENSPFSTNASLGASTTPSTAQHAKKTGRQHTPKSYACVHLHLHFILPRVHFLEHGAQHGRIGIWQMLGCEHDSADRPRNPTQPVGQGSSEGVGTLQATRNPRISTGACEDSSALSSSFATSSVSSQKPETFCNPFKGPNMFIV